MRIKMMLIALTLTLSTSVIANDVDDAIKAAKSAQKEAASLGFEWRDTEKTIKRAEAAAKEGKHKKAIKLANIIVNQLSAVRKQAAIAKTAGPRF